MASAAQRFCFNNRAASMLKYLCFGATAAVCLAVAMGADAADLSMTPIYQTRPPVLVTQNGGTKDQSRPASVRDAARFKLLPGAGATVRADAPSAGRLFWTGVYDRF